MKVIVHRDWFELRPESPIENESLACWAAQAAGTELGDMKNARPELGYEDENVLRVTFAPKLDRIVATVSSAGRPEDPHCAPKFGMP